MNKLTKKLLRLAAIFIPLGILLIIVGIFTGAKRSVSVVNGKIVINEAHDYNYENYELTDINNIDVDVNNAKIIINESKNNNFGVSINLRSKVGDPTIKTDNKILQIQENSKFSLNFFSWDLSSVFDENSNEVIVYVPKGISLKDVTLNTSNGRIEITNLNADNIKADTSNGAIITDNVIINENTSLKSSNGQVELGGSFYNTTYVHTSNGKIIGDGIFKGKTTFKTSNGSISFNSNISRSEYNIVAETSNGTIRVNDSKVDDDFTENKGAANTIDFDTSNGGITIELK